MTEMHTEYGVFRRGSDSLTPLEGFTFRTHENAERFLAYQYTNPDMWEICQRSVSPWRPVTTNTEGEQ